MTIYYDNSRTSITLIKQINSSGEGVIWKTNRKGCLAKIYHQATPEKIKKLQLMVANPPDDPAKGQNHVSIAWPIDLIKDNRGNYVGFLMPEIRNSVELLEVYHPKLRNKKFPEFNWYCLQITALNVALTIKALHSKDYIVGDMKTQNLLVNSRGQVSIVDTDSFQVKDQQKNKVYRCPVGSEGFTPPELIGKNLSTLTQTRYSDRFRLGVVIYLLLFSHHPFMGTWKGNSDPPGQDESISKGYWPYGINSLLKPSLNTIELDIVHPNVKQCFLRCFNDGHKLPTSRPSPQEWVNALSIAIKDLKVCSSVNNHIYNRSYGKCYWCERAARLKYDIFPVVKKPISLPRALIKSQPKPQPVPAKPTTKILIQPVKKYPPNKTINTSQNRPGKIKSSSSSNVGTVIFWVVAIIVLLIIVL